MFKAFFISLNACNQKELFGILPCFFVFFSTFVIQAIKVSTSQYSHAFIIFPTFVIQALQASSSEIHLQMVQFNCGKICHIFRQWHNVYLVCLLQSYIPIGYLLS